MGKEPLIDGAILSQGNIKFFKHNDVDHLDRVLSRIDHRSSRILICTEGVYSADGDKGNIEGVLSVAQKYGATVLVDEAHSLLIAGPNGRGVAEEQGVLEGVDMLIGTLSKCFGGVGGFLFGREELVNYVSYYARSRMFSCAIDPAVTGGLIAALRLAAGSDGTKKRQRIQANSQYFRSKLKGKVNTGNSQSWIIPVIYGDERITIPLSNYLQHEGLEASLMMYPAMPKKQARIRLFVSAEHTHGQMNTGSEIILKAAEHFGFLTD